MSGTNSGEGWRWLRRRRWIAGISISLVLGAIVNIGVAWWLAHRPLPKGVYPIHPQSGKRIDGTHAWVFVLFKTPGRTHVWAQVVSADRVEVLRRATLEMSGPKRAHWVQLNDEMGTPGWAAFARRDASDEEAQFPGSQFIIWRELASGWPMYSLESAEAPSDGGSPVTPGLIYRRGFEVPIQSIRESTGHPYLAVRPIWPGFAVNTAFYAIPWLALLLVVGMVRRRRRRREGHCAVCRYDLSNSAPGLCPECGAAHA